jgi:hypothetical protein
MGWEREEDRERWAQEARLPTEIEQEEMERRKFFTEGNGGGTDLRTGKFQ